METNLELAIQAVSGSKRLAVGRTQPDQATTIATPRERGVAVDQLLG